MTRLDNEKIQTILLNFAMVMMKILVKETAEGYPGTSPGNINDSQRQTGAKEAAQISYLIVLRISNEPTIQD